MTKIYLDAGHGGKDSGAVGNGLYEKNVVLDLAKRVEKKLNDYKNVQIMQTRTTDVFLSLSERTKKANLWGADCFISFHLNSHSKSTANGFETFIYSSASTKSAALQNVLHEEVYKKIGKDIRDRGKKRANFHVLRETGMAAVLGENLFVSNSSEAAKLKQNDFLDRIAEGYAIGLEKFFGLERKIRPPTNNAGETLYQVVAGTFSNYDNAEQRVKELKAKGYNAFIQEK